MSQLSPRREKAIRAEIDRIADIIRASKECPEPFVMTLPELAGCIAHHAERAKWLASNLLPID
jgi:hypothetical protein